MSKGGGDSQTQTQTYDRNSNTTANNAFPQWSQGMQQYLGGTGAGLTSNFLQNAPSHAVAGFNPDQMKAFDLSRDMAQGQFTGQTRAQAPDGNSFKEFLNPYLDTVGKDTVDTMRREYDNNVAKSGARHANSVAFGGSGDALEKAQMARGFNQDATSTIASLLSSGYDRANNLAFQKSGMDDQFRNSELNRQLATQKNLFDVGQFQQGQAQRALDVPFDMLNRLAAVTPRELNSAQNSNTNEKGTTTTTSPDDSPSGGQQALGAGLSVLGMGTGGGGTLGGNLLGKLFGF